MLCVVECVVVESVLSLRVLVVLVLLWWCWWCGGVGGVVGLVVWWGWWCGGVGGVGGSDDSRDGESILAHAEMHLIKSATEQLQG